MAIFKLLHGDASNISLDITPFHEGWCYMTHTGEFYADLNIGTEESPNNQRIQINKSFVEQLLNIQDNVGYIDAGNISEEGVEVDG